MSQEPDTELVATDAGHLGARVNGRRLPPTQRRAVRHILANPEEVAFLTSTALAERAGVSQATISRVAVALGFNGFVELRDELRRQLYDDQQPITGLQPAVKAAIDHLESLQRMLDDPEPLARAIELLAASSPLPVVALRISAPLGQHVTYRLARFHPDVRSIDQGGSRGAELVALAAHAGAQALLCVNLPRYAAETTELVTLAHQRGLKVIMITDDPLAPGADLADVVFAVPVGTRLVFDSHAAPTVLASILVDGIADALGRDSQEQLELLEDLATERGTFIDG